MRRIHFAAAALSAVLASFVGVWAYFFPLAFYDSFPGILGSWVSVDGPFNEHLIRDVGAMYLALGGASVGSLIWRNDIAFRILGIAWTIFGALHFAYHALHLHHMPLVDAIGEMVALGVSLLLGILLLIPARRRDG
ncbi:hypothetical protein [Microbacterium flavescens]|jgi:hypothetical protein|uniref:hypothetical protein n=1 Tax=Microbacterium flavescens TaxID=69366 RepID=UPI001BDE3550|nr:hypothetical protein [Microbacterium flavescens]BFF12460.1 hypothetical protein GCM10025699_37630 [Microbacterium flavescens]